MAGSIIHFTLFLGSTALVAALVLFLACINSTVRGWVESESRGDILVVCWICVIAIALYII